MRSSLTNTTFMNLRKTKELKLSWLASVYWCFRLSRWPYFVVFMWNAHRVLPQKRHSWISGCSDGAHLLSDARIAFKTAGWLFRNKLTQIPIFTILSVDLLGLVSHGHGRVELFRAARFFTPRFTPVPIANLSGKRNTVRPSGFKSRI